MIVRYRCPRAGERDDGPIIAEEVISNVTKSDHAQHRSGYSVVRDLTTFVAAALRGDCGTR